MENDRSDLPILLAFASQGPTRFREFAMAGKECMQGCGPKPLSRLAGFFNILLMAHFWGTRVRSLGDQRNTKRLLAMVASDLHSIFVGIFNILFFDPKKHPTFRTFFHKHGHNRFSIFSDTIKLFITLI